MARGITARLRRIEEKTRPKGAQRFVVWGRDEAEVERIIADARKAGVLRPDDKTFGGVWTLPSEMPRSRWTSFDEVTIEELTEGDRVLAEQMDVLTGGKGRETFIRFARENGHGDIAGMMERGELP